MNRELFLLRSIPDESQHPFLIVIGFFFRWPLSSHCHYPICSDMHDLQHLCQIIKSFSSYAQETKASMKLVVLIEIWD